MHAEDALEALFQNDYADSDSNSSYNDTSESESDVSINSGYNEKSTSQHVHNNIISQPVPQVIDEVNISANAQESFVAFYTQINLHFLVQHDQPAHVCDVDIDENVQTLEESTSSGPTMGNEPIANIPSDEENYENEINNGNETVNIPTSPSSDVEFDIPDIQMPV